MLTALGMQSPIGLIALAGLAVAIVALVLGHRRYSRQKQRIKAAEQRAVEAEAIADRAVRSASVAAAMTMLIAAGRSPRLPIEAVSQFGEDAFVWELLGRPLDGYFIEVGAYDGYWLSATYFLESLGWRGLLVEPIPERYEQCKRLRAGSRVEACAVSRRGSSGTTTFQVPIAQNADPSDRAAAVVDMGSSIRMPDASRAFAERKGAGQASVREITVPLTSLRALLESDPTWPSAVNVDLAVIDVEGLEAEVLDGLELGRTRPRVLLVEELDEHIGRDAAMLTNANYTRVCKLGHNVLWIRSDEQALIDRARVMARGPSFRGELAIAPPVQPL
ncbi:MAG: FkbM family methyltransferase [Phycisphaeraceae bacterium]|nr:FkbM family methyltransferase [Phycisphaeraceae bacterium]